MEGHHYERRNLTDYPQLWKRRVRRNWPFMLWLVILAVVALLYARNQRFGQMTGTVQAIEERVTPLETARLTALHVKVGQRVKAGDALAQLDTAQLDADAAVEEAELRNLRGAFDPMQQDMVAAEHEAEAAVEEASTALKTAETRQQSDAALMGELRKELERREALHVQKLLDEREVQDLKPQIAALEKTMAAHPELISIQHRMLAGAERRLAAVRSWMRMSGADTLSAAISNKTAAAAAVVEARLETYAQRKRGYTLRAAKDGVIAHIYVWPGNVAAAGSPILDIVEEHPKFIMGFLPETEQAVLRPGQPFQVWRTSEPSKKWRGFSHPVVSAVVESLSPEMESLPVRISPMQVQVQGGEPLRGRRVLFRLTGESDLVPGETVELHAIRTGWRAWLGMGGLSGLDYTPSPSEG